MVTAFVLISAVPARVAGIAQELVELDSVSEVYSVAGDIDLVCVVRVRNHEQLADVVTGEIAKVDGILETTTLIAFRAYSRKDLEAMWAIGAE
jgi:DNA-binding Lrp family transcriptional regulator